MDMPVVVAPLERAVTLDPDQSAALRDKLLTELTNITSADLAAAWAHQQSSLALDSQSSSSTGPDIG
jgi:hypothetical protein